MAVVTPPGHSFTADENNSLTQAHRQGLSTSRTTPQNLAALMTSIQRTVHQAPKSKPNTQVRKPQCTHTTMNRRHGHHLCHICGQVPALGFLYSCDQDHLPSLRSKGNSTEVLPVVPDHGSYFDAQAEIAKSLGMSSSVIRQMRAGEYCYEQIEKLLAQRRHVKEVMRQVENPSTRNTPSPDVLMKKLSKSSPESETIIASAGMPAVPAAQQAGPTPLPMTPAGTPYNTPVDTPQTSPTKAGLKKTMKCNFQVCHACRPFFQDRVPMSMEAVLSDEIPPLSEKEMAGLLVRNAAILSTIRDPDPSPQWMFLEGTEGMDLSDGIEEEDTPTTTGSGWTDALLDEMDEDDPYPCPGAGICPVFSPSQGCAYDSDFDDGMRALRHQLAPDDFVSHTYPVLHHARGNIAEPSSGTSSKGSSISLPDAAKMPLTPTTPSDLRFGLGLKGEAWFGKTAGKAATICGDFSNGAKYGRRVRGFGESRNESSSSLGSEVEVEGGVALTEEAVETGMPDILNDYE